MATPMHSAPAVVPRPGFQNRRCRSPLLKSLFPAGFSISKVRSELLIDPQPNMEPDKRRNAPGQLVPLSFTRWTRGETEDSSTIASYSMDDNGDPFADCAGPTLKDLVNMKRTSSQPRPLDVEMDDPSCSISRCRIYTGKRAAIEKQKKLVVSVLMHIRFAWGVILIICCLLSAN